MAAIKMSFVDMKVSSSSILFLIPLQLNCRIFKFKVLAFDFALGAGRGGGEGGGAARVLAREVGEQQVLVICRCDM